MFGYLTVNPLQLSKQDRRLYRSFYCGLCDVLQERYGTEGRKTLSYDLTFIAILLTSVYDLPSETGRRNCPLHPVRKHDYIISEATGFACDMNLLLYYYKCLDDYHDENKNSAYRKALKLEEHVQRIREKYPRITAEIADRLAEISEYEKHNTLNADLPANSFGILMSQILSFRDDETGETLRAFGYHLGRFIYLMDAAMDIKYDLRHQLYNPLITTDASQRHEILELVMADVMAVYEKLPVNRYTNIIENVIYSGIWTKYNLRHKERNDHEGSL